MIKLIKNTFFNEEETKNKLCDFIKSADKLSMGEKVADFEKEFSRWQGRTYSVMFNSGSSANLALLTALKNEKKIINGHHMGFSALTWATNVMPILQHNIIPVALDISLKNLNIGLSEFNKNTDNIDSLFITNALGFSSHLDTIKRICEKENIMLLEDNCESLGSMIGGTKLGNFGLASTFSFFVGHHLSTIEGGMVCTDDYELYEMLKMVRAHGWTRNNAQSVKDYMKKKYEINDFYEKYSFYHLAYNFRPTEIQGFLGLEGLKYIDSANMKREENYKIFSEAIERNDNVMKFDLDHMSFISNFAFPLIFKDNNELLIYRNKFKKAGIEVRPIIGGNIVKQPFYNRYKKDCCNASHAHNNGLYFPNNPDLTEDEINSICEVIKK